MSKCKIEDAIKLCKALHAGLAPKYFPALTGGIVYKDGDRKDIDVVIYRNRETPRFELSEIQNELEDCELYDFEHFGFVTKCKFNGLSVDLFNPESTSSDNYDSQLAKEAVAAMCFNSQKPKQPAFNKGQITEIRSVNYQNHSGDGSYIPNHYLVIVSVCGSEWAEHLYFDDTEKGKREAYSIRVGDDMGKLK